MAVHVEHVVLVMSFVGLKWAIVGALQLQCATVAIMVYLSLNFGFLILVKTLLVLYHMSSHYIMHSPPQVMSYQSLPDKLLSIIFFHFLTGSVVWALIVVHYELKTEVT